MHKWMMIMVSGMVACGPDEVTGNNNQTSNNTPKNNTQSNNAPEAPGLILGSEPLERIPEQYDLAAFNLLIAPINEDGFTLSPYIWYMESLDGSKFSTYTQGQVERLACEGNINSQDRDKPFQVEEDVTYQIGCPDLKPPVSQETVRLVYPSPEGWSLEISTAIKFEPIDFCDNENPKSFCKTWEESLNR